MTLLQQNQVRFNRVPEKVLVKVWGPVEPDLVLHQSQVRFNRVPEMVPVKVWEALVQSQGRLNRVPEKVPVKVLEKVHGRLWCRQVRFNRGGFGAEPGQVQQGSEV